MEFRETAKYLGEDPEKTTPEDLFGTLSRFMDLLQSAIAKLHAEQVTTGQLKEFINILLYIFKKKIVNCNDFKFCNTTCK